MNYDFLGMHSSCSQNMLHAGAMRSGGMLPTSFLRNEMLGDHSEADLSHNAFPSVLPVVPWEAEFLISYSYCSQILHKLLSSQRCLQGHALLLVITYSKLYHSSHCPTVGHSTIKQLWFVVTVD